jgi:iron complex outermembrane receptor protein
MNNLPQVFQNTAADFSNTPNPLVGPGGVTTAEARLSGPERLRLGWQDQVDVGHHGNEPRGPQRQCHAYLNYRSADPVSQGARDFSACKLNVTVKDTGSVPACNGSPTSNQYIVTAVGGDGYSVVGNQFLPWPQAGSAPPQFFNSSPYQYLSRADTRYTAGAFANYEVNDYVRPYADVMFMNDRSTTAIAPSGLFEFSNPGTPTGGMLVNCDNPFLSAQQQATIGCTAADIAAGSNADLSIGRRNVEGGPRVATYEHMNYRLLLGNKGTIGSAWNYDVYGSYYYTTLHQSNDGYVSWSAASKALQVVDVNGTPTCKSVIDQTDRNCVPWNIFSQGGVTQDALKYLNSFGAEYGTVEEKIIAANVSGNLGEYGIKSPWASDGVGVSVGIEHRTDTENFKPDAALLSGDLSGTGGALTGMTAAQYGHISPCLAGQCSTRGLRADCQKLPGRADGGDGCGRRVCDRDGVEHCGTAHRRVGWETP